MFPTGFSMLAATGSLPQPAPYPLASALVAGAYLVGSIPTAYWLGRAKGLDIRQHGSGNVGATNALRVLGKKLGIFCLVFDMLKGALPVLIAARLMPAAWPGTPWVVAGAALAAILGHIFTIFLRFKGGKGVASTIGAMLALDPGPVGVAIAACVLTIFIWRYVSLGSLVLAIAMPIAMFATACANGALRDSAFHAPFAVGVILSVAIVARHTGNIKRLMAGTERKIGAPREPQPEAAP